MSRMGLNKGRILNIGFDTIYYIITKYALHYTIDASQTKNLDTGDVGVFLATDGIYTIFFEGYFDSALLDNAEYNCEINKYGSLMAGASIINLVMGRKDRILDNLISIGASGAVSALVDGIRGKSRCVARQVGNIEMN
jgi:hypothetical protein